MQAGTATKEKRNAWIAAIEKVEQLGPTSVVAAHQRLGEVQGVWHLHRTKEYLKRFGELVESGQVKNAKELAAAVMKDCPDRLNSGALIVSSRAAFPKAESGLNLGMKLFRFNSSCILPRCTYCLFLQ